VTAARAKGGRWHAPCRPPPERSGLGAFAVLLALVSRRAFVVAKRWGAGSCCGTAGTTGRTGCWFRRTAGCADQGFAGGLSCGAGFVAVAGWRWRMLACGPCSSLLKNLLLRAARTQRCAGEFALIPSEGPSLRSDPLGRSRQRRKSWHPRLGSRIPGRFATICGYDCCFFAAVPTGSSCRVVSPAVKRVSSLFACSGSMNRTSSRPPLGNP